VAEAKETELEIDSTRELYRPFATRGSILYFCIADLMVIDPMYQYSLQWYGGLFSQGILNSEPRPDVPARLEVLKDFFTYLLYENICRSLFEKHKLLFSFNLCIKIMQGDDLIDAEEWRFLLTGQAHKVPDDGLAKPAAAEEWLTDKSWGEFRSLSTLKALRGLDHDFVNHLDHWKALFDSETCHESPFPGKWNDIGDMQKMVVLRALRPDKLVESIQNFIIKYMGQRFIEPPPFDMKKCFDASFVVTPLIFVLTSGSDPTKDFFEFAAQMGMGERTKAISLGQGQGPIAARMIEEGISKGAWVLLQNCHLCSSWMDDLELIVEELNPEQTHSEFRLWLTSMPTKTFPVSVLQSGIKMTKEPPKGMRSNLKTIYFKFGDDDAIRVTNKPRTYMKLLFGLCFFHALIQERRKFGPLGWNIPYEFNDTDLDICVSQLQLYLDMYDEVPWEVLNILTSYINYGGRVTDSKDLRTIDVILRDFYCADILEDGYKFSESGVYQSVKVNEGSPHRGYMEYIESLPVNAGPEVFGMHDNANISYALTDTFETLDTLQLLQPRSSGGGGTSREDVIYDDVIEMQKTLPLDFDLEGIAMQFPTRYEESMNTLLQQESTRFQRLLAKIRSTLGQVKRALKGLVVMSGELEAMSNSIYSQKIPELWDNAYPSLKPLRSFFAEFLDKCKFLQDWIDSNTTPSSYWISCFFFPQAFLTGQLQNYARKHVLPVDTISFEFAVSQLHHSTITEGPGNGAYIYGLFLEGARYDLTVDSIVESHPKQLYTDCPTLHLVPKQDYVQPTENVYECPVYKTLARAGTLSTTGHSTNFVLFVMLPSNQDRRKWIKAGVALFTSLKY